MAIFSMWSSAGCLVAASLLAGVSATIALSSVFFVAVGYIASAAISSSFTAGHLWPDQRIRLIYPRCRHNFLLSGQSRPGPKQPQKARKSSSSHAHLSMVRHLLDSSGTVSASPKHDLGPKPPWDGHCITLQLRCRRGGVKRSGSFSKRSIRFCIMVPPNSSASTMVTARR
jgi:hypothetical protein